LSGTPPCHCEAQRAEAIPGRAMRHGYASTKIPRPKSKSKKAKYNSKCNNPSPFCMLIAAFFAPSFSTLLRLVFRSQGFAFPGLPRLQLAMTPPFVIARSGSDEAISKLVAISYQLSVFIFQPLARCCLLITDCFFM